ncbi:MAG TPA: TrkA family potassium uptake protein [Thermomicrobiales bacterium]|jgi:trk system potassium uptake protein TrkA|nr:TrkA family potassium uptake protein [Thermomicrobiales bacterium]
MHVVIMGCGRVGSRVAGILDGNGHTVAVIEIDQEAFRRLPPSFRGQTILGTGIDEDVLRAARIESADAFIAVSGQDNRNIMATQLVQLLFDVGERICRITDPVREDVFRRMGVMTTVCPTTTVSATIIDTVNSHDPDTTPAQRAVREGLGG